MMMILELCPLDFAVCNLKLLPDKMWCKNRLYNNNISFRGNGKLATPVLSNPCENIYYKKYIYFIYDNVKNMLHLMKLKVSFPF